MPERQEPPAPGSVFRSALETRTLEDGSQVVVTVRQFVAVDDEWIDVREMIDVWRRHSGHTRTAALQTGEGIRYLNALRAS